MSSENKLAMSKAEGLIPEMRFPEFKNEGEWSQKNLAEFNDLVSGDGNWILSKDITPNGEFKIVQLSSIGFGALKEKVLKTISNETFHELKGTLIQKGDLLINRMVDSNRINCCIFPYDGKYVTSVDVCWIRSNSFFDNYFLMSSLCEESNQIKLLSLSSGSGRVRISKNNLFEKFHFLLPKNPNEQQKIASCLSSLDELISAHSQKLELLKDHKKGLMQNLFPQEGETVPKYRFPEFENDGEWVEKKLGEVAEINRGKSKHRPRNESFLYGGRYPFIQTGNIREAGLYLTKFNQTYSEAGLKQSKLWNENTLCVTIAANIAETTILKIKACFPDSVIGILPKTELSEVVFLHYQFEIFKERVQSEAQGVAQANLNQEKLSEMEFVFPPTIGEQQKIAFCLSSVEELITAQTEKIEQLKLHKKGLMQGLFPKIND